MDFRVSPLRKLAYNQEDKLDRHLEQFARISVLMMQLQMSVGL